MKKGNRMRLFLALSSIFALMLLAFSHGEAKSKVPEVVNIKVGGVSTLSGPGAMWHGPGARGEIDYFKHFNKQGGMEYKEPDGSKHRFMIDHKYEDCVYQPSRAATSYGRLRDWGAHMITTHGSSPASGFMALANRDHVPVLHIWSVHVDPAGYMENVNNKYLLPHGPTNVDTTAQLLNGFKRGVWDKEHPGKPFKVGIIAFDNPPRRLYKGRKVKDFYKHVGIDLVGVAIVPISVTDVTIQLKRLHSAGARTIVIDHITSGVKVVLEDAERIGIKDEMSFITWFNVLRDFLAAPDLFDGIYNPFTAQCYYTKNRSKRAEEVAKIYLDSDPKYWEYRVDWMMHVHHVLDVGMLGVKSCLEKHGYEGFTREKLRDSLFSLTEIDTGLCPKFTMDPTFPYTIPYIQLWRLDAHKKQWDKVGPLVAPGPSLYQPRWNPSDDPSVVLTNYYKWP